MSKQFEKKRQGRYARHKRVRGRVVGTSERPRLNVFRSLTNIYAQVIDDQQGAHPCIRLDPRQRDRRAGKGQDEIGSREKSSVR